MTVRSAGCALAAATLFACACGRAEPLGDLSATTRAQPLRGLNMTDPAQAYKVLSFDLENPEILAPEVVRVLKISPDTDAPPRNILLLDDFDLDGLTDREMACAVGAWVSDPGDPVTRASLSCDPMRRFGGKGCSLSLNYRIETIKSTAAGFWLRFRTAEADCMDLSGYRYIAFVMRGVEGNPGFTSRVMLEMRNAVEVSSVLLSGITNEWKEFRVPLSQFAGIEDWMRMTEMLLIVEPNSATDPEGILLVDDVKLVR